MIVSTPVHPENILYNRQSFFSRCSCFKHVSKCWTGNRILSKTGSIVSGHLLSAELPAFDDISLMEVLAWYQMPDEDYGLVLFTRGARTTDYWMSWAGIRILLILLDWLTGIRCLLYQSPAENVGLVSRACWRCFTVITILYCCTGCNELVSAACLRSYCIIEE